MNKLERIKKELETNCIKESSYYKDVSYLLGIIDEIEKENKKLKSLLEDGIFVNGEFIAKKKFTCFKCNSEKTCPFAWDTYNLNGDCLMEK
jgi:hypothetical protein